MTARFLLDTDICIYALTRRKPSVVARFDRLRSGEALISLISFGELSFGASKSRDPGGARAHLDALTSVAAVESPPLEAAAEYADIRRSLELAGRPIGSNDLWIAAHARSAGLILVTNNQQEFSRVAGLKIQNWT